VRAQLPDSGAREVWLERDGDRPDARHPAQHAEIQDGSTRDPRARPQDSRQLAVTLPAAVGPRSGPTNQHSSPGATATRPAEAGNNRLSLPAKKLAAR